MSTLLLTAALLAAPTGEASAIDAALRWLTRPEDPQLRVLLGLCAAAALLGLVDRALAGARARRGKHAAEEVGGDPEGSPS